MNDRIEDFDDSEDIWEDYGETDLEEELSLCNGCGCMTKTIGLKDLCGKCSMEKGVKDGDV